MCCWTGLGADLGDSVAAVEHFWGGDWPREIIVVATGTDAEFAARANLDPNQRWTDIAAVSVADTVDLVRREVTGARIVLAPGAARMSDSALRIVLTHELFTLRPAPTPLWTRPAGSSRGCRLRRSPAGAATAGRRGENRPAR